MKKVLGLMFFVLFFSGCQSFLSDESLGEEYFTAVENENWQEVVNILDIKIKRYPNDAESYLLRALALRDIDGVQLDRIIKDFSNSLKNTEDYRVRFMRAMAFFRNMQYAEADADFDFLIKNMGYKPILVQWKANAAFGAGNFEVAQELYKYRYSQEGDYEVLNQAYQQFVRSEYFAGNKEGASWDVAFAPNRGFTEDTIFTKQILTETLENNLSFDIPKYTFNEVGQLLKSSCESIDILWSESWHKPRILERLYKLETPEDLSELLPKRLEVTRLNLAYRDFKEFPKEIQQFKNVQEIRLSGNRFDDLENVFAHLSSLPNLKVLELNKMNFKVFPENFDYLTNLEVLSLEASNIRKLPESISTFKHLRFLSVRNNGRLKDLPASIQQLTCLEYLDVSGSGMQRLRDELADCTSLRSITANASKIKTLPKEIGNLSQLQFLNLGHNKITEVPPTIGDLSNLKKLSLGSNEIEHLPSSFSKLKSLGFCGLAFNRFKTFPNEVLGLPVHNLWLHNNGFPDIPVEAATLPNLTHLLIDHEVITDANITILKDANPDLRVIREDSRKYVKGRKRKI